MALQKVDTEAIAATAQKIRTADGLLTDEIAAVHRAADRAFGTWNGAAGATGATQLYQLLLGNEARSAVLENYANLLQQVAAPGYDNAEEVNTELADLFL